MKKVIRILIAFIYIGISICLSSCTVSIGGRETGRIAIVTSMAIDYEDGQVIITCEVANSYPNVNSSNSPKENNQEEFIYPQGKGKTISDAIEDINLHFDKMIFLAHSNLLIVGEEFAKNGIIGLMDFFLRDNQPREDVYILVAKGIKAYDVIGVRTGIGKASGDYLYDILNNFPYNGRSINISLTEYFRYFYDIGNNPVVGVVSLKDTPDLGEESAKKTTIRSILDVSGGAVLKENTLVGYYTGDEMIGFNLIVGDMKRGKITFKVPEEQKKNALVMGKIDRFTTVNILKAKRKHKITIEDGKIHLTMDVKIRADINEINQALNIKNPKVMEIIEKSCSENIRDYIIMALEKSQKEFKEDNLSIGVAVHQQYPKIWKEIKYDWHNIFSEISYDVNVKTTIVKTGLIVMPTNIREGE